MGRLKFLLIPLILCLGLLACESNPAMDSARQIISDIPLPNPGYSQLSGNPLVYDSIKIEPYGYRTDTGEAVFQITCEYHESVWWRRIPLIEIWHGDFGTRTLIIPDPEQDKGVIGSWRIKDQHVFSATDLKRMHDFLVWR